MANTTTDTVACDQAEELDLLTCPITGIAFREVDGIERDGTWFHRSVEDTHNWVDEDGEFVPAGETVYCEDDGNFYRESSSTVVQTGNGEVHLLTNCRRWNGEYYTPDWLSVNTFLCDDCGGRFAFDDACNRGGYAYCEGCDPGESSAVIRDSGDRTASGYRSETKDALRFGLEMEMETTSSDVDGVAEQVLDLLPASYGILKEDGSLDDGFEFVTRPDSLAVHSRILGQVIPRLPSSMRASSTGRCGIHIHVTRSALTTLQQGKMLVFINHPSNKQFVETVAARSNTHWAVFREKKHVDAKERNGGDRYQAINVTPRTLEFRIFRGSVKLHTILKNLEFVAALCGFTSPASKSLKEAASVDEFCRYVRQHRKTYPTLDAFLVTKGYLGAASKPNKLVEAPAVSRHEPVEN